MVRLNVYDVFGAIISLIFVAGYFALFSTLSRGKSARNEAKKLSATALNNVAVALLIGAAFAPYFTTMTKAIPLDLGIWAQGVLDLLPIVAAAISLHIVARIVVASLED